MGNPTTAHSSLILHPLEVVHVALESYVENSYSSCVGKLPAEACSEHTHEMCPVTEIEQAWNWIRAQVIQTTGEFIAR